MHYDVQHTSLLEMKQGLGDTERFWKVGIKEDLSLFGIDLRVGKGFWGFCLVKGRGEGGKVGKMSGIT